eukprot:SAG31_NODE_649_length_13201_cov_12.359258_1_plen_1662_part_00
MCRATLLTAAIATLHSQWASGLAPIKFTLDGSCGPGVTTISGIQAECDPTGDSPCCSASGFCGGSEATCDCPECTRFVETSTGTRAARGFKTLQCDTRASDLAGFEGNVVYGYCPKNCSTVSLPIWGTGIYTDDSPVCLAGVHASVLPRVSDGLIRIVILGRLPRHHYVGTARNGVLSRDWTGSWHRNFRVLRLTQGAAMLGPGNCAVSFSGHCPPGYVSSTYQFDTEDVVNQDLLGPVADSVPFSLRNCSQADPALQLQCTDAPSIFPRLVFCCDGDYREEVDVSSRSSFAYGATGLVDSGTTGTVTTAPLTMATTGTFSSSLQCGAGSDRTWFRLDTEDSQNQDRTVGAGTAPAGLTMHAGKFPTLIMCRPKGVVSCHTTAIDLWNEDDVQDAWAQVSSDDNTNTWSAGRAASCKLPNGTAHNGWSAFTDSQVACERTASGRRWGPVTTVPPPPPPSSSFSQSTRGTAIEIGSTEVTLSAPPPAALVPGLFVAGPGIVPGTRVATVNSETSFTISAPIGVELAPSTTTIFSYTDTPFSQTTHTSTIPTGQNTISLSSAPPRLIVSGMLVAGDGIPAGAEVSSVVTQMMFTITVATDANIMPGALVTFTPTEADLSVATHTHPIQAGATTISLAVAPPRVIRVGMTISGSGIAAGAVVSTITNQSSFQISTPTEIQIDAGTALSLGTPYFTQITHVSPIATGSASISLLAPPARAILPGMTVAGYGIRSGTTVSTVHSQTLLELSAVTMADIIGGTVISFGSSQLVVSLGFGCLRAGYTGSDQSEVVGAISDMDTAELKDACEVQRSLYTYTAAVPSSCINVASSQTVAATTQQECEGNNGRKKLFLEVICPASCAHEQGWTGRLFGAGTYAGDTPVCLAGVHDNKLYDSRGGSLLVWLDSPATIVATERLVLQGADRHGIRTFGVDMPMQAAVVHSSAGAAALTFSVHTAASIGSTLTRTVVEHANTAPALAALIPSIGHASSVSPAAANAGAGLGHRDVPVVLGFLALPVPPDYRPDWARLSDLAFFSPDMELRADGTVAGAALGESVWAQVAKDAGASRTVADIVSQAQQSGVRCHLVLRCYDAAVFREAASTSTARQALVDNIITTFAKSSLLTEGQNTPTISWDGLQLDIQQFHSQQATAYVHIVRALRRRLSSIRSHRPPQLTVTLPAQTSEAAKFAIASLRPCVDYFVLLGHELAGESPFRQPFAVPPAPLFTSALPGGKSLAQVVTAYLAEPIGVSANQLVLALPWYGLEWNLRADAKLLQGENVSVLVPEPSLGGAQTNMTEPTAIVDPNMEKPLVISLAEASAKVLANDGVYNDASAAWWYYVPPRTADQRILPSSSPSVNNSGNLSLPGPPPPAIASPSPPLITGPAKLGWVEDAKSFGSKLKWAVQTMKLRGVAIASLGLEWAPATWNSDGSPLAAELAANNASAAEAMANNVTWPPFPPPPPPELVSQAVADAATAVASRFPQAHYALAAMYEEQLRARATVAAGRADLLPESPYAALVRRGAALELSRPPHWHRSMSLDEAAWETLGEVVGTPSLANSETVECDLCLLSYGRDEPVRGASSVDGGSCPLATVETDSSVQTTSSGFGQWRYGWIRFHTESQFNADQGGGDGPLPSGFTEAPHKTRSDSEDSTSVAFFPRLEFCCRRC